MFSKAKKQQNKGKRTLKKSPPRNPKNVGPGKLSTAPVAIGRQNRSPKANIRSMSNGDCRITHREYIQDVTAQGASPSLFKSEGFPVNPGMPNTFPWLSQIAPRFEKYLFHKLIFRFETEAPTSLGGSLILTLDYDASDPAPASKVQAMSYKNAVRSAPWEECSHFSAKEDLSQQKAYFVRSGSNPVSTDIKLYDVGNLFICSQNVLTGGATLGELYVEYDVTLQTPQLQLPSALDIDTAKAQSTGGTTALVPLGAAPIITNAQLSPLYTYDDVTGVLTFLKAGTFGGYVSLTGTGVTAIDQVGPSIVNGAIPSFHGTTNVVAGLPANTYAIGDTFQLNVTATTVTSTLLVLTDMALISA